MTCIEVVWLNESIQQELQKIEECKERIKHFEYQIELMNGTKKDVSTPEQRACDVRCKSCSM